MLKVKTFCVEIQRSIYAKQPNIVVLEQKKTNSLSYVSPYCSHNTKTY